MKTINRSEILSFPGEKRLPAFLANNLRDCAREQKAYVWIGVDGVACDLAYSTNEMSEDDPDDPGNWFVVHMDTPYTIPTPDELAAADWLRRFRELPLN
jgi:hypothetical protein